MKIETTLEQGNESNCYILEENGHCIVIDPNNAEEITAIIEARRLHPDMILLTHEHVDHILGLNAIREQYSVTVIASEACSEGIGNKRKNMSMAYGLLVYYRKGSVPDSVPEPFICQKADKTFQKEYSFLWQGHRIRMESLPGHSNGSTLIFLDDELIFSGDYLLRLPDGSFSEDAGRLRRLYQTTVNPRLSRLPIDRLIYPGHGAPFRWTEELRALVRSDSIFE